MVADDAGLERGIDAGVAVVVVDVEVVVSDDVGADVVGYVVEVGEVLMLLTWWWCVNNWLALKIQSIC